MFPPQFDKPDDQLTSEEIRQLLLGLDHAAQGARLRLSIKTPERLLADLEQLSPGETHQLTVQSPHEVLVDAVIERLYLRRSRQLQQLLDQKPAE